MTLSAQRPRLATACSDAPPLTRAPGGDPSRPHWDAARRRLTYEGLLVKQFRGRPGTQEIILAVFEEEGWPARIDDPLPPKDDMDPKTRVRNTLVRLNRAQRNALLRFEADGVGGILWFPREDQ